MLEHVFLMVKLGLGWVQLFIPVKFNREAPPLSLPRRGEIVNSSSLRSLEWQRENNSCALTNSEQLPEGSGFRMFFTVRDNMSP